LDKDFELLCVSSVVWRERTNDRLQFLRPSRGQAQHAGITGILLFDGTTLLHYLEGSKQRIEPLLDDLHLVGDIAKLQIVYRTEGSTPRCFNDWQVGLAQNFEIDLRQAAGKLSSGADLKHWLAPLMPHFDVL
jgi:hypothetical protein